MTKFMMLGFCLILACINIGCQKEDLEISDNLISGTYTFKEGFKPFLTKEINFDAVSLAQSFDETPAEEIQLRHDYKIEKHGGDRYLSVKWDGKDDYQIWCRITIYGDLVHLNFSNGEVVFKAK